MCTSAAAVLHQIGPVTAASESAALEYVLHSLVITWQ
jgi:hypothetical protein